MDKIKFGCFIRQKRNEKNLTQKELADLLLIDVTAVSKWERGITYPDITLIPDICKYLDCNEHELIESSNDSEYRQIRSQAQKYKRLKDGLFYSFSIAYLLAILVCFTVNLTVNGKLSWFFIVFASCLCGFTFMPTVTRFFTKAKFSVFVCSTYISLFAVYLTCSLYTKNFWFPIAASGTLLGYFAFFYPFMFFKQKAYFSEEKFQKFKRFFFLTYAVGLWLFTSILLFVINFCHPFNIAAGEIVTVYCYSLPFLCGIFYCFKFGVLLKTSISFLFGAPYLYHLNYVLQKYFGDNGIETYTVNFKNWAKYTNGNVLFIFSAACICLFLVFLALAFINRKKQKK